ncbi:hypothetical protein ANO11243_091480 [Dothideomycetidae sp. 11243]|nr:hypothetical protein ANO11243_091480 [fungal sp. No.11243]
MADFKLARASPEDMLEIVRLQFRAFPGPIHQDIFLGPNTPEGHEHLARSYVRTMQTNSGDYWMKVTEKATGKIVAATEWRIHPTVLPDHAAEEDMSLSWLQDKPERLAFARDILGQSLAARRKHFTEPYILGTMMIDWGCPLADQLFLPIWISASSDGRKLYQTCGFHDVEDFVQVVFMKRDPKIGGMEVYGQNAGAEPLKV